jgi:hypothetical protein
MKGRGTVKKRGKGGRRMASLEAKRPGLRVVVAVKVRAARKIIVFLFLVWSGMASATTYYVSSSAGNDANNGTSTLTPWQTIAHVNALAFLPGDSILFKRGDVWNESLVPPSSGSSGNRITFDAYGTGAAPNLTGYYSVPSTAWVLVTGNAWKAAVPATYTTINFCLFGSIWGQKVGAVSSNLTAQWDYYLANGFVYVYSQGNPATYYNEAIVPMALSNVPVINVNGMSWLTFQHFLVNWFDQYGVYVQGASDHLVFANMESDSMIPQGTQPLGFYVNESTPGPGDIKIYNSEAHLNYDGFRFDGAATAISMINDKGYANRDGALVDNTGAVTYSRCHFYASSLAVAGSTDVEWTSGSGPIAGGGNIAADTPPAVQVFQRYPAEVTLTVDDAGMTPGADTYYASTVLPLADAASVPVGVAITVGYPLAATLVSEFQGWVNAGRDVTSHSMSHTYYTNTDALEIQYIGSGTAATLSISGKTLTITVTGASDSVSYNLAQGQPQGTIQGLRQALVATGKFTATETTPCQGLYGTGCSAYTEAALLAQDLADVSGQNVKSAVYPMQLDVPRLTTDEIALSRQWMTTNLTGLPATPVYVYPGGYETTTMQGITAGVPYSGARGALKEDLGVFDTYADGFNVQNVTSFGVNPSWQLLTSASLNQKVQALVWKEAVWGVPWGIFWHLNELSSTEITNLIQDFKANGATIQTNTGLVNWLRAGTQETGTDGNYYYKLPATSMALDFRPTKNSPVVDAGENLGTVYAVDINGVNQNSYGAGWEIGAHVFQGYAAYGEGTGAGRFTIGAGAGTSQLVLVTLPQLWVNNHEGDTLFSYELSLPNTWVTVPAPGCTFHAPYWTGSPTNAGLQSAINDIETCRTTTGVGLKLDIPPALYTSVNGLTIPQSSTTPATNFLILDSTQDASLTDGQTVCSHGIQDNLAASTDIGIDNPACNGSGMYYQLGTTQTSISAGAFTLANGTATNTSAYDDVQYMWTVEASGVNVPPFKLCGVIGGGGSALPACGGTTNIGPDHWLIEDMEARMSAGSTGDATLVSGGTAGTETLATQYPSHIHFRKVWAHGDWTSLATGANSVANGFNDICTTCSITDSAVTQALRPGKEGHSVLANGTTYKIDHNWFEGSSSCVFTGGYSGNLAVPNWVPFQDVEMRRNRCTFPYGWLGQMSIAQANPYWGSAISQVSTNGTDVTWLSGDQFSPLWQPTLVKINGVNYHFATVNNSTSMTLTTSAGTQSNVSFVFTPNNIVRKNAQEMKEGERVLIQGNIFENVDNSGGQNGTISTLSPRNTSGGGTGSNYQSTINDVSFADNIWRNSCDGWSNSATSGGSGDGGGVTLPMKRVAYANNLMYNISSSNPGCGSSDVGIGATTFNQQWVGTISENSAGTQATFVATCSVDGGDCPSGPPSLGYGVMGFSAGDAVQITGCTGVPAFNVALHSINGRQVPIGIGPLAVTGTNPFSLTVTYPWATTANSTDATGTCTVSNVERGPGSFSVSHLTFITNQQIPLGDGNSASGGPNFAQNNLFRDSIILTGTTGGNGWRNAVLTEGCPTEQYNYDYTSLTADFMVWPTRTGAPYCEVGNNASYADPNGCTGGGCNPPMNMFFPANPYCTGSTSSSACVGFTGAMNLPSGPMPLTLSDYHQYGLRSDSSFHSAASDGTDMGANLPAIDSAQTQNLYVCATGCGTGPYPDSLTLNASPMFGFTENGTSASNWPTVNYGMQRFWDSPPLQWPSINTGPGAFDFSNLDTVLAQAYSNGATTGMYTLARTPPWATSNPSDTSCNYTTAASGGGDGECDAPSDLNNDGSGTNAIWKAWVTAIATHVNGATYLQTHAHIRYWEIWNEPDNKPFWAGSIAQLARLTEDANCIITGRGVVHQSGDGTAVACTATAIDPGAKIVMASAHAKGVALTYGQNELYCSATPTGYQLPCPNPANAIAAAVDILNFHMKPGNESGNNCPAPTLCTPESAMQMYVANVQGILQPAELAKPLWDGEASYSTSGFTGAYSDTDMAASFMPRFYLINWTLGISGMAWYTWDQLSGEPSAVQTSYQQTYNWLAGSSLTTPCTASGTVWSCGISKSGKQYLVMWDSAQSCSGGSCTTGSQTVGAQWTQFQDMTTASTPAAISGHAVPVGIKPVVLS